MSSSMTRGGSPLFGAGAAEEGSQRRLELFHPRFVADDAPRRGAALSGRTDRTEYDAGHRDVQVGVLVDDNGVVSAKLQEPLAHPCGNAFTHFATHRAGSRE